MKWSSIFTRDHISLFLINLIPLFGVLYWNWEPLMVIVLYVAETIMVGLLHILYMTALYWMNRDNPEARSVKRENEGLKGGCLIPFFLVHFGFFVFIQTMVFGGFNAHANIGKLLLGVFSGTYKYAILTFFVIRITGMVSEFMWDPGVRLKLPDDVFFQPYARIFVQQFMVILGGWFVVLGAKNFMGYLIVLVVSKTFFELLFANINKEWARKLLQKKAGRPEGSSGDQR